MSKKSEIPSLLLTVATGNPHKVREIQAFIAGCGLSIQLSLPLGWVDEKEVDETGQTFLENAWLKAHGVIPAPGSDYILAEDSGVEIPALAGQFGLDPFPGLQSNRWLTKERCRELGLTTLSAGEVTQDLRNQGILTLMANQEHRDAAYHCGLILKACTESGEDFEVLGTMPLWVTEGKPRGAQGFGYDPIMGYRDPDNQPRHQERTVAQLLPDEKLRLSHRGVALTQMKQFLREQTDEVRV